MINEQKQVKAGKFGFDSSTNRGIRNMINRTIGKYRTQKKEPSGSYSLLFLS